MSLHLILDNYGTHGHERVRRWLVQHPRFVLHFIPTSSSWLNLVERWFAELSQKAVRRGAFRSVADLEQAIEDFMTAWNAHRTPFVWTATVEKILEKLARCRRRLEQIQPGCTQPKRQRHRVHLTLAAVLGHRLRLESGRAPDGVALIPRENYL